jgi:hypothetical protein
MGTNSEHSEVSMTYGDLYQKHPILADCIESHEWDNMTLSEQRNWALSQADGHKTQRFKDALETSKTIAVWTKRALAAETKLADIACAMASILSFDQCSLIGRDVERRASDREPS